MYHHKYVVALMFSFVPQCMEIYNLKELEKVKVILFYVIISK